jgi:multidrug efflux pump subunit AcrA (membrane-fusion protein)
MSKRNWLPGRRTVLAGSVGLVVGLLIAGTAWWIVEVRSSDQAASAPTSTTRSVAAAVDTIKKAISTSGTLTPAVQQDVSFVASGTVTDVAVSQGQQVTAGQALATVDTLTMQQTLAEANLTLAKAQATLVTDQATLATAQTALATAQDDGVDTTAAQAKVDTTTQQVAVDQTSITAAQASVDAAQTALDSATLTSPIDGIVSTVNLTVGKKVTGTTSTSATSSTSSNASGSGSTTGTGGSGGSGASSGTGTGNGSAGGSGSTASSGTSSTSSSSSSAAFVIVGTDSWKVDVTVDSAQVGLLAAGDQAQLTADGSTQPLFGTVSSVGLISTSTGSTAGYPVEVTVTGSPTGLHDGANVTVSLIYEQHANVLTVPSAAIHTENGQSVVYQTVGGQQVSTVVQTGDSDGTNTEITSGLSEGDEVLVTVATGGAATGGTGGTGRTGTGTGTGGQGGTGTGSGRTFGGGAGAGGFGGGTGGGAGGFTGGGAGQPPAGN